MTEPVSAREQFLDTHRDDPNITVGKNFALELIGGNTATATARIYLFGACEAERGMLSGQGQGVEKSLKIADGNRNLLVRSTYGIFRRSMAGESWLTMHFKNASEDNRVVTVDLRPRNYSGLAVIDLDTVPTGTVFCKRGSWLLADEGNAAGFWLSPRLDIVALAKKPFWMQRSQGEGLVLLGARGTPLRTEDIPAGQTYKVDWRNLHGFTDMPHTWSLLTENFMDHPFRNTATLLLSKERPFQIQFTGPGKVILYNHS